MINSRLVEMATSFSIIALKINEFDSLWVRYLFIIKRAKCGNVNFFNFYDMLKKNIYLINNFCCFRNKFFSIEYNLLFFIIPDAMCACNIQN